MLRTAGGGFGRSDTRCEEEMYSTCPWADDGRLTHVVWCQTALLCRVSVTKFEPVKVCGYGHTTVLSPLVGPSLDTPSLFTLWTKRTCRCVLPSLCEGSRVYLHHYLTFLHLVRDFPCSSSHSTTSSDSVCLDVSGKGWMSLVEGGCLW